MEGIKQKWKEKYWKQNTAVRGYKRKILGDV